MKQISEEDIFNYSLIDDGPNFIGTAIKKLRAKNGLTQKQVADGICSVKQFARIENNRTNATTLLLSEISHKLGNSIFNYIPYSSDENLYEIKNEISHIMKLYNKFEHQQILNFINSSRYLRHSKNKRVKQELGWILGAISNYIDVGINIDENYYFKLLQIEREISDIFELFQFCLKPNEYRILNSLIVLYLDNNELKLAQNLLEASIENFESSYAIINDSSYTRFIYNLSRLHLKQMNFGQALSSSQKGIEYCINSNFISYLPDLYNICGRAYYKIGEIEKSHKALRNYVYLSRIYKPNLDYESVILNLKNNYNLEI